MILKRQAYDEQHRLTTSWTPNIESASRYFDDDWRADVLELRFPGDKASEKIVLEKGEGVYLCNDAGKTIEVLSRLSKPVRE